MESTLSLQSNLYPKITPAGAYYAISSDSPSASRTLLYGLLRAESSEAISSEKILAWADTSDINTALNLLYRLQRLEFLYGDENVSTEDVRLSDEQLSGLLAQLSGSGKALLADEAGLYFANVGFHHEAAEELGLLASEVARMESNHRLLIQNNLYINNSAWGICDPSGQSELTFFPLYIGTTKLILVIGGMPDLNKEAFVTLVKALYHRYGSR
ncbi:peptidase M23 [Neisseria chenwenguii]|uniref:Peptidase M23 n=1 Tax=Neisseria chenwenguii TaxID=1853278 RepID=A0A220S0B9_9NEIS|nr:peptidase M23 [Neisseria chenwenguii]ASK26930.1 peptidase M23 [Neisseria chenwenguii]ROV56730.1 peptidase M23 [Neisseria chenwenguii]